MQALSIRSDKLQANSACLKKLVPIIQQAQIDFLQEPADANKLIIELVKKYDTGWQYSQGVADYAVEQQKKLGIISNGPDATLGNMDMARIQKLMDVMMPVLTKKKIDIPADLKAEDLATNEFVDTTIGLS